MMIMAEYDLDKRHTGDDVGSLSAKCSASGSTEPSRQ